ncbi:MAG: hypothetical protein A3A32_01020 [Candidatus Wildermuthbacteria bacterium RIFCSPLOWO2_01_FULL_48_35]|uniref:Rod shape-determining protein MreD n=1 Tax=Candidatus Wildermuthbacteria bacterium RIFCSPLOWO2_01_FULL_48_35 TaxID=1802463 RepID=A0A1G2RN42_9BACT|nr:MAG: hypothetical protein A3A32_01020 [Candidatus Wildermuthbacteria bacterium RIFCSPLOWO2_01_FULL_48_35]
MRKIIVVSAAAYLLVLLQIGFLPHLMPYEWYRYLLAFFVILITVCERPRGKLGFAAALAGGFFADVFSEGYMGTHLLLFLVLVFAIKFILRHYVRFPTARAI